MVVVLLLTVAQGGSVADYRQWCCGGSSYE